MCKEIALKGYFQGVRKIAQVAGKTAQVWKGIAQVVRKTAQHQVKIARVDEETAQG